MDSLTPPLPAPPAGATGFFIGFIRSGLEREGYINVKKWLEAVEASEQFLLDQERRRHA